MTGAHLVTLLIQILIEHKLSKEDIEAHFYKSAGFIQVLFTEPTKELYGIKFRDDVEGEEFYVKMMKELGNIL